MSTKGYRVEKRGQVYDMGCEYCTFTSRGWDLRKNAVSVGQAHVLLVHKAIFLQGSPYTYGARS